ncbi:hypothetical protein Q9233_007777 [Columba guinea]|nr:hypothetical protein Q9233_007777 [Columba guinea]
MSWIMKHSSIQASEWCLKSMLHGDMSIFSLDHHYLQFCIFSHLLTFFCNCSKGSIFEVEADLLGIGPELLEDKVTKIFNYYHCLG